MVAPVIAVGMILWGAMLLVAGLADPEAKFVQSVAVLFGGHTRRDSSLRRVLSTSIGLAMVITGGFLLASSV
jgi:hypothetical protein